MRGLVDPVTLSQLASIKYRENERGQIEVESKEEMRERGVRSPDRAESLMLASAETSRSTMGDDTILVESATPKTAVGQQLAATTLGADFVEVQSRTHATCSQCAHYRAINPRTGRCMERLIRTTAAAEGCPLFTYREVENE